MKKSAKLTVTEGKFHLVKRLFSNMGNKVISLKRIAIGELELDQSLKKASTRELSPYELSLLVFRKIGKKPKLVYI